MHFLPRLLYPSSASPTMASPTSTASSLSSSAPPSPSTPAYDLILVGASGFVGKLATTHLLKRYGMNPSGAGFSWALSARNKERLDEVHEELAEELTEWWVQEQQKQQQQKTAATTSPTEEKTETTGIPTATTTAEAEAAARAFVEQRLGRLDVIVGDVDDPAFARELARNATVIAASLTPYSVHGKRLVEACVAEGTHYVDILGEMLWIKENIEKYHEAAKEKGVRIVHACGLGSVPADLSVYLMLHRLHDQHVTVRELKFMLGPVYSSLGGGSMTSYATLIKAAVSQGKVWALLDPHYLTPDKLRENTHEVTVGSKAFGVGYDTDVRRFTAPLWLAALDDQVVARSAGLLGYPPFRYVEAQSYSSSVFGLVSAALTWVAAYAFAACLVFPPWRWLLTKLRPSGSGPNRLLREGGSGTAYVVAKGTTPGGGMVTYVGEFDMPGGDPGYNETAKMLVESALCLVVDMDKLPHRQHRGGVLTPASAFGECLMERLHQASGMTFKM